MRFRFAEMRENRSLEDRRAQRVGTGIPARIRRKAHQAIFFFQHPHQLSVSAVDVSDIRYGDVFSFVQTVFDILRKFDETPLHFVGAERPRSVCANHILRRHVDKQREVRVIVQHAPRRGQLIFDRFSHGSVFVKGDYRGSERTCPTQAHPRRAFNGIDISCNERHARFIATGIDRRHVLLARFLYVCADLALILRDESVYAGIILRKHETIDFFSRHVHTGKVQLQIDGTAGEIIAEIRRDFLFVFRKLFCIVRKG